MDHVCSICFEDVDSEHEYIAPCSDQHRYHCACIVAYGQKLITSAVKVEGKAVSVTVGKLPRCPLCRSKLTWAHRTRDSTDFYIISGNQCMLKLGSVDEGAAKPRLRLKQTDYSSVPIAV